jgi:hypothetical protein
MKIIFKKALPIFAVSLVLFFQACDSILEQNLLTKAKPDECYNGMGESYTPIKEGKCAEGEKAKVNESYLWGLVQTSKYFWIGTVANIHCTIGGTGFKIPGLKDAKEFAPWVCEQKKSLYPDYLSNLTNNSNFLNLGEKGLGDFRVPSIYTYDKSTKQTKEITPKDPNIFKTIGLRSAGVHNGVIFMAGPAMGEGKYSVAMYAFKDDANATYLGSHIFTEYNNIRKWLVVNDVLYTTVGVNNPVIEGKEGSYNGRIIRWEGDATNPFKFKEVGYIASNGADLALHNNHMYISTWPSKDLTVKSVAGIYMSPDMPKEGLDTFTEWKEVWNVSMYEPDPVLARTYGGGALASFDGYLYWGTLHVPDVDWRIASKVYKIDINDTTALRDTMLKTHRGLTIFRAKDFDATSKVELLYGEEKLNRYIPKQKKFVEVPNNMQEKPLWGHTGFDNWFNQYAWSMKVYKNQLYIGTMDWSYLEKFLNPQYFSYLESIGKEYEFGGDLWRIPAGTTTGAVAEDLTGQGNNANCGIRTMLSDSQKLYLGTANPMNLMMNKENNKHLGGWELIEMKSKK